METRTRGGDETASKALTVNLVQKVTDAAGMDRLSSIAEND